MKERKPKKTKTKKKAVSAPAQMILIFDDFDAIIDMFDLKL